MSGFTRGEVEYMRDQQLGRLATVDESGRPHVVPVGFRYNPELGVVDVRGRNLGATKKFRDVARTGRVALVVDDVLPPWRARGVEVRGRAEALEATADPESGGELIRIFPERIVGWGIDPDARGPDARSVST
ncbi:MAG TPA: PPOX class F420-dependent oxidoreductase [Rubrobacter sp.]|nr:PPOX class F420-dependent oxidoreductase [Rubrobacter sp.]